MNYRSFIDKLISYSSKNSIVQYACEGDIYEILNSKENRYGTVVWATENLSLEEGNMTVTGNLIYADRLLNDSSNKIDVQSAGITALQSIITEFVNDSDDMSVEYISMTPYTEKFADLCAGAYVNVSFTFLTDVSCLDDTEWTPRTISITKNGEYGVSGMDKAIVNVQPKLESLNVTENGIYLPSSVGADGYDKVEVNTSVVYKDFKSINFENADSVQIDKLIFNNYLGGSVGSTFANIKNGYINEIDFGASYHPQNIFRVCNNLFYKSNIKIKKIYNFNSGSPFDMFHSYTFQEPFEMTEDINVFWNSYWPRQMVDVFSYAKGEYINISNWNFNRVQNFTNVFSDCTISIIDMTGWKGMEYATIFLFYSCKTKSFIGYRTLEDVEANNIALIEHFGKFEKGPYNTPEYGLELGDRYMRYSSLLAFANGIADMNGVADDVYKDFKISKVCFDNCYNDDDTTPSSDVIAERQNRIRTICANKNWNLVLV